MVFGSFLAKVLFWRSISMSNVEHSIGCGLTYHIEFLNHLMPEYISIPLYWSHVSKFALPLSYQLTDHINSHPIDCIWSWLYAKIPGIYIVTFEPKTVTENHTFDVNPYRYSYMNTSSLMETLKYSNLAGFLYGILWSPTLEIQIDCQKNGSFWSWS